MTDLADYLFAKISKKVSASGVIVIGLSGPQGSGKTTASNALQKMFGGRCAILSLDDFYLSRDDRLKLGQQVSGLLDVRGPPGTHDIAFLRTTIDELKNMRPDSRVHIPVFSKVRDDREPAQSWRVISSKPDVIIVEGWCVGARDIPNYAELGPMNDVERSDTDHNWLDFQRQKLSTVYKNLWDEIDAFYYLEAPAFETVLQWRTEQEATNLAVALNELSAERKVWVARFLEHYERITRAMAKGCRMPGTVLQLSADRRLRESKPI